MKIRSRFYLLFIVSTLLLTTILIFNELSQRIWEKHLSNHELLERLGSHSHRLVELTEEYLRLELDDDRSVQRWFRELDNLETALAEIKDEPESIRQQAGEMRTLANSAKQLFEVLLNYQRLNQTESIWESMLAGELSAKVLSLPNRITELERLFAIQTEMQLKTIRMLSFGGSLTGLTILAWLVWSAQHAVINPLLKTINAINRFASGDHDAQSRETGDEEIAMLARHFNDMRTTLVHSGDTLEKSEIRYHNLFSHMSDGVAVYETQDEGRSFVFIDFNQAAETITGLSRDEVLGKNVHEVFPGVVELGLLDVFRQVWRHGVPTHHPTRTYKDERITLWVDNYVYQLPCREIVAVFQDVTEERRAQEALRQAMDEMEARVEQRTAELAVANERLKELDRLKSLFIASMSHELRTPLNSIIGFSGLLLQGMAGPLMAEQHDYLSRINSSGKYLHTLINDVIDISKLESGHIDRYADTFRLNEVVEEAIEENQLQATTKGLTIERELTLDQVVRSDRKRLLQCLLNLLSNAVKYTEAGGITVRTEAHDGWIELSVRDTGVGIAQEDQKKLFRQFSRIDSPITRSTLGTGLGLYLTRKLATEVLGGEISVLSSPGEGSTFRLRIPQEAVS